MHLIEKRCPEPTRRGVHHGSWESCGKWASRWRNPPSRSTDGRPRRPSSPTWKVFLQEPRQRPDRHGFLRRPYYDIQESSLFSYSSCTSGVGSSTFNITEHPTASWTAQQVVDAFPWDKAPRYLLRDRDRIYGDAFRRRVRHMGIEEVIIAPRSGHGRIRMSNGSSGAFVGSSSIMSSS